MTSSSFNCYSGMCIIYQCISYNCLEFITISFNVYVSLKSAFKYVLLICVLPTPLYFFQICPLVFSESFTVSYEKNNTIFLYIKMFITGFHSISEEMWVTAVRSLFGVRYIVAVVFIILQEYAIP